MYSMINKNKLKQDKQFPNQFNKFNKMHMLYHAVSFYLLTLVLFLIYFIDILTFRQNIIGKE